MTVITPKSITGLLLAWLEGENDAERKAIALTPFIVEKLAREHTLGELERNAITDLILEILVDAYAKQNGIPAVVEVIHAQRRDTLRVN